MGRGHLAPPASLALVHGAGSGPWAFAGWQESFDGTEVLAVDLHDGLDVAHASHEDYASRVLGAAGEVRAPVALCGWSMGGLVSLQAAQRPQLEPHSILLLEPSPPAEAQGFDESVEPRPGVFDPEEAYGRFPSGMEARPESLLARAERKRGISVPALRCQSLVVVGDDFREERGAAVAELYGSELVEFPGLGHWDLVRSPEVRLSIARFLGIG
ncbi:MAG TPA: alpha/beta hydrolase [Gaiellaceae bacterium]|nr:alpha/beta hydrolase [Gaiellaceae bacterium]